MGKDTLQERTYYYMIFVELIKFIHSKFYIFFLFKDNLSHWLWHETENFRTWAMNSTFVTGVRDGTLHPTSFGKCVLYIAFTNNEKYTYNSVLEQAMVVFAVFIVPCKRHFYRNHTGIYIL